MKANVEVEVDVVVVGSGAGGMSAAIRAAHHGAKVLVIEKTDALGGCTAYSGGIPWVPCNAQMQAAGMSDSPDAALQYLLATVGPHIRRDLVDAYLTTAPAMLNFFQDRTCVRFQMRPDMPDYASAMPGATQGGRCLDPLPYDARGLGEWLHRLRKPRQELTLFGGMMVNAADIRQLLQVGRNLGATWHGIKLLVRYARDRLSFGRATRLVAGNALAARLLRSALDRNVEFWTGAVAVELLRQDECIVGVKVRRDGCDIQVRARRGTVLATGGYPHSKDLRARFIPWAQQHRSMAPEGNTGDGIAMAVAAGAVMDPPTTANAFYTPVSIVKRTNGTEGLFPHLITDRAKPGVIAVDGRAQRFTNEAESYHDFVLAMQGTPGHAGARAIPAYLICDAEAIRRYGLGMVRPAPFPKAGHIRSGYLKVGRTLDELARRLRLDGAALQETVKQYNQGAEQGMDSQFGKGTTSYNRYMGDKSHPTSACNAPLRTAPFYAVELATGDIGTSLGVRVDRNASALDGEGNPIRGLYVCGNDMTSMMVGTYATGGITIGPALTFGYIAADHMFSTPADVLSATHG